jgi:hypothetical protein
MGENLTVGRSPDMPLPEFGEIEPRWIRRPGILKQDRSNQGG